MRDAERARETAKELAELLAAYQQELSAWEPWTPAAAPLREAIGAAIGEAHELIAETRLTADLTPTRTRTH